MTLLSEQTTAAPVIEVSDMAFSWPGPERYGISIDQFSLVKGSRTLLLGPSGSGKSTFLSLLCGIATPKRGTIRLLGTDITKLTNGGRDRFRAEHIGIIFQMFNLLPYGSVVDNVLLPLSFAHQRRQRAEAAGTADSEAIRLLRELGLSETQCQSQAAALSVGQQQRVAVARALIGAPEIIVADEPTSALDKERQAGFLDLLFEQVAQSKSTLVMVSHDETLAARFDQVLQLTDIVEIDGQRATEKGSA
ncbi:MAG: putative ABC transport system ATP-binding protein [Hyphomicrobiaceae bacterium]|jgi:putative ABC transport system ATP-binding protein